MTGVQTCALPILQKYEIAKFYNLPLEDVDADVVLQDDSGRRRGRLLNLEWNKYPETAIEIGRASCRERV